MLKNTHLLFCACLLLAGASSLPAASVEGDWSGTLRAGPQTLRLALHLATNGNGKFTGTLDSLDQGAMGLKITSATLEGNQLKFRLSAPAASFSGTVSKDGRSINGTWSQGAFTAPLAFERTKEGAAPPPVAGVFDDPGLERIEGTWQGHIIAGQTKLRIVIRVEKQDGGHLVTLQSPDQGPARFPVSEITVKDDSVQFAVKTIGGSYKGSLNEDSTKMSGTWSQGGNSLPLSLEKTDKLPEARRPQVPHLPYPYRAREIEFPGGQAGVQLAGTLTLPRKGAPFPAAVLITGSGPQDRDETVMRHKPFLVLADYLTRRGIAVLRYDDRGVARSTGNFAAATSEDFAHDADAAVRFLLARDEINHDRIGLIGHSEGALIAPLVANRNSAVAFLVLLACPGMRGDQVILSQTQKTFELAGAPADIIEQRLTAMRKLAAAIAIDRPLKEIRADFDQAAPGVLVPPVATPEALDQAYQNFASPWMRYFLRYDPVPSVARLKVPALAIYGAKDVQVIPELNAPKIRAALQHSGIKGSRVEILPGLNHLLQTCKTGAVTEYAQIEETISPQALNLIATWIFSV